MHAWAGQFAGCDGKTLRKAAREIVAAYKAALAQGNVAPVFEAVEQLVSSPVKEARMIAGFAIEMGIVKCTWNATVERWIAALADDPLWDIREGAQLALKAAMEYHLAEVSPVVRYYTTDPRPNLRRAALMACRPKPRMPAKQVAARLVLAEPLLADRATYVRRNVPYVLGFFQAYGDVLLPFLLRWARSGDELVRQQAAEALGGSVLEGDPEVVFEVLAALAADRRKSVASAVARALKSVTAAHPEFLPEARVRFPEFRPWLDAAGEPGSRTT